MDSVAKVGGFVPFRDLTRTKDGPDVKRVAELMTTIRDLPIMDGTIMDKDAKDALKEVFEGYNSRKGIELGKLNGLIDKFRNGPLGRLAEKLSPSGSDQDFLNTFARLYILKRLLCHSGGTTTFSAWDSFCKGKSEIGIEDYFVFLNSGKNVKLPSGEVPLSISDEFDDLKGSLQTLLGTKGDTIRDIIGFEPIVQDKLYRHTYLAGYLGYEDSNSSRSVSPGSSELSGERTRSASPEGSERVEVKPIGPVEIKKVFLKRAFRTWNKFASDSKSFGPAITDFEKRKRDNLLREAFDLLSQNRAQGQRVHQGSVGTLRDPKDIADYIRKGALRRGLCKWIDANSEASFLDKDLRNLKIRKRFYDWINFTVEYKAVKALSYLQQQAAVKIQSVQRGRIVRRNGEIKPGVFPKGGSLDDAEGRAAAVEAQVANEAARAIANAETEAARSGTEIRVVSAELQASEFENAALAQSIRADFEAVRNEVRNKIEVLLRIVAGSEDRLIEAEGRADDAEVKAALADVIADVIAVVETEVARDETQVARTQIEATVAAAQVAQAALVEAQADAAQAAIAKELEEALAALAKALEEVLAGQAADQVTEAAETAQARATAQLDAVQERIDELSSQLQASETAKSTAEASLAQTKAAQTDQVAEAKVAIEVAEARAAAAEAAAKAAEAQAALVKELEEVLAAQARATQAALVKGLTDADDYLSAQIKAAKDRVAELEASETAKSTAEASLTEAAQTAQVAEAALAEAKAVAEAARAEVAQAAAEVTRTRTETQVVRAELQAVEAALAAAETALAVQAQATQSAQASAEAAKAEALVSVKEAEEAVQTARDDAEAAQAKIKELSDELARVMVENKWLISIIPAELLISLTMSTQSSLNRQVGRSGNPCLLARDAVDLLERRQQSEIRKGIAAVKQEFFKREKKLKVRIEELEKARIEIGAELSAALAKEPVRLRTVSEQKTQISDLKRHVARLTQKSSLLNGKTRS